jgi:phenylalanyl-tRNA synthetase alpha subunit
MAEAKKTTTKAAEKKTAPKATVKKTAAPKAAAAKAAVKTEAKKTAPAVKKTTTRTKKAAAVKETISIQFAGKEYTTEQLVKIAKDIWEFDLKKNPADFAEVQLYVKPEEAKAYYVINGTEAGSFNI